MIELKKYIRSMKPASVNEIKQKLKETDKKELIDICQRLARFKKENKELLTFLLFEEDDLPEYIKNVKEEIDEGFVQVNTSSIYFAKKTIRKVLRIANKHIRYTGSKTAEAEILLHYLTNFKGLNLHWQKSTALVNLYKNQLKKIDAVIATMHEDLQYDYQGEIERLKI
jgi:gas vesicle protein